MTNATSQQRAPAENLFLPPQSDIAESTATTEYLNEPAYFNTPLFIGVGLFLILLSIYIIILNLRNRKK
jgi:hypothetical protein